MENKKKFFTLNGRIVDIISMATQHRAVFTISRLMEDYEISKRTAYRTLKSLKTIDYITVRVQGEDIIIKLKK